MNSIIRIPNTQDTVATACDCQAFAQQSLHLDCAGSIVPFLSIANSVFLLDVFCVTKEWLVLEHMVINTNSGFSLKDSNDKLYMYCTCMGNEGTQCTRCMYGPKFIRI